MVWGVEETLGVKVEMRLNQSGAPLNGALAPGALVSGCGRGGLRGARRDESPSVRAERA